MEKINRISGVTRVSPPKRLKSRERIRINIRKYIVYHIYREQECFWRKGGLANCCPGLQTLFLFLRIFFRFPLQAVRQAACQINCFHLKFDRPENAGSQEIVFPGFLIF